MPTPDDALALWRHVQSMHWQLTAILHHGLMDDVGISYQDFIVLSELSTEERRVVDLARSLGLEKSRLSHHLDRMVGRGIVTKRPAESDRRGALVAITAKGRRLHQRALPGHLERVALHFGDHLTGREADALRSLTSKVEAALPTSERIVAPRRSGPIGETSSKG